MNDKDLNINNYKYDEILNIFSIPNNFDDLNVRKMEKKLEYVKKNIPDYYSFFLKGYKIICTIYNLYNKNYILNNTYEINSFIDKIKNIDNFEILNMNDIIKLLNLSTIKLESSYTDIRTPNIQEQVKTNIVYSTVPNTVGPGALNSIKRVTQELNLNLNTCFRNNYYNSNPCDFQYTLPTEIKHVVSMRLASIEIPNTWYLFSNSKNNNKFYIVITNNNIETEYEILIPEGNYDNDSLQNYLNSTYFYLSPNITDLNNIKFTIDKFNFKSSFELVGVSSINVTIIFLKDINFNMMNTFGWTIGFRLARYININDILISEALFDGGGDRYVYMALDDYQYNNNIQNIICFDNSLLEKNIIAKIPMINGKLSMIIDDNSAPLTKTRKYNGPVNIRNLNIKILDSFGNIIDINNMDYSFTLELEILYEGFNFKDVNS
jgi:hypothetical protein